MKKRSAKKDTKIKLLFNKVGMTYVELICALALLSLVVVMFTPMLLSSYDTLYKAGEKVEDIYQSKEEMESELATRHSTSVINFNLKFVNSIADNATVLFDNLNVKGRRIVSTYQQDFETAFGMIRPRIEIITPNLVYDDKSNHDITIQTMGLEYKKVSFGNVAVTENSLPNDQIHIKAILPNKAVANEDDTNISNNTQDETVYELNGYNATINLYSADGKGFLTSNPTTDLTNNVNKGQISFNLSGTADRSLDFTYSPVKIVIYYKNNRGKLMTVSDYLYIDPPTMVFAGETDGQYDYYTSAGVEYLDLSTKDPVTGDKIEAGEYVLNFEGRKMRVDNSGFLTDADTLKSTGNTINTVTWVAGDENKSLKPYYVMAGTNGTVYRMYNYAGKKDSLKNIMGAKNDVTNTIDKTFILTDGARVSPSFWSGEMSDQYYFRTEEEGMGYGATDDNTKDCSRESQYDIISKKLKYLMMFSGGRTGYYYRTQASRRISYVLTEAGNQSFRIAGKKDKEEQFAGYTGFWEPTDQRVTFDVDRKKLVINTTDERPVYLYSGNIALVGGSTMHHYEKHLGYLSAFAYTSIDPYGTLDGTLQDQFFNQGYFWANDNDAHFDGVAGTITNYLQTDYANRVNISSAVYLPGSGSRGQGQVIYFGSVPAFTIIRQSSDIEKGETKVYNNDKVVPSRSTAYFLWNEGENGTRVFRHARNDWNDVVDCHTAMKWGSGVQYIDDRPVKEFFTKGNDNITYSYSLKDVDFTFGYCSRWRMTAGDVTHNGAIEETKSYEKYYKASRTEADYDERIPGSINGGSEDNMYYNVWFPGEHYTLTHTVTCDEVTVAVGYTISGSTFMEESSQASGYYGTALGSVYNDAVLAAYVSEEAGGAIFKDGDNGVELTGKGEQNSIFQNLLYYKSPKFIDRDLHSRQSVRFTAVGMYTSTDAMNESVSGTQSVNKNYVAIYGDSLGNAYYSIIANSTVTGKYVDKKDENGNVVKDEEGNTVQEWVGTESGVRLRSEEAGNALKARALDDKGVVQNNDMIPILVGGQPLSTYFTEITTVVAEEGLVVISGKPRGGDYGKEMLVVCYADENGNYSFKMVENSAFTGYINDAKIIGNYLYFVGGDSNGGWCAAIAKEELVKLAKESKDSSLRTDWAEIEPSTTDNGSTTTDPSKLIYFQTPSILNAFDGRVTKN